ncbi:hypothetical protein [Haloarcula amylolytica]|uniref:hypothetical protein n=1 Tax=Haloarcula amylolytica TaxID=396317 RepID=UPI003C74000D
MTRRSRREIERAIEDLTDTPSCGGEITDADLGVTAEFVTYEADVDGVGPEAQFQTVVPGKEDQ